MEERLQKLLAQAGVGSRRQAEEYIHAGRVTIDGKVAKIGDKANPKSQTIQVDGYTLKFPEKHSYMMLYKPRGIVSTANDELKRRAVLDYMPKVPGLHTVGRLDRDSEGMLLLTTDGEMTLKLTHPRFEHQKEYRVWVHGGDIHPKTIKQLIRGIDLEDGISTPLQVLPAEGGVYITLGEGRKHQIRRMMEAVGHPVSCLVRVRQGTLFMGDLRSGEYRDLTEDEIQGLLNPEEVPAARIRQLRHQMYQRWGFPVIE